MGWTLCDAQLQQHQSLSYSEPLKSTTAPAIWKQSSHYSSTFSLLLCLGDSVCHGILHTLKNFRAKKSGVVRIPAAVDAALRSCLPEPSGFALSPTNEQRGPNIVALRVRIACANNLGLWSATQRRGVILPAALPWLRQGDAFCPCLHCIASITRQRAR